MKHLYLASQSPMRHALVASMGIPFTVIDHSATEVVDSALPPVEFVLAVARQKMEHLIMPIGQEGQVCFVLTADTMGCDAQGGLYGKPADRADAIRMLKILRKGAVCYTGLRLEKRIWQGAWKSVGQFESVTATTYELDLPDRWIADYLDNTPNYVSISGAFTIEGYGAQFLKWFNGSYTGVLGLPLNELRRGLEQLGFFED